MRMAIKMPVRKTLDGPANDVDPREVASAEIIDFASRNAYPAVTQRKGKSDALGMVAGVALVAGLGLVTLWSMNSARLDTPEGVGGAQAQQTASAPVAGVPAPVMAPDAAMLAAAPPPQTIPSTSSFAPSASYSSTPVPAAPTYVPQPGAEPAAGANRYASPAMVFDSSAGVVAGGDMPGVVAPSDGPAGPGRSAGDFAARVGGVGGGRAQAQSMVNPSTTVVQGTLIPAVLETAIDTNVPGYARAVVSRDVRSFDGKRILIPRSSRLIGQYQSGLQNGQKRAYVIWQRLIRPDGSSIDIASPAVDFDGTTGLRGQVKSNFFQRFGSAMLLSVVGGLSSLASGGASVVLGGGQSAAAAAAQQDGQVGPTVRVRQGAPIGIFTSRDLDFTQVGG